MMPAEFVNVAGTVLIASAVAFIVPGIVALYYALGRRRIPQFPRSQNGRGSW